MKLAFVSALAAAALFAPAARADITIDLGFLSFDNVIPGAPGFPGVNGFSVYNFTGGFFLPPSFPSLTPVTFMDAMLDLSGPSPQNLSLGDLAPGAYDPFSLGTAFPDSTLFTSATFTVTLSATVLDLGGGNIFTADSAIVDVILSPSLPPDLTAGVDFSLIPVSGQIATPEPASIVLLATAVFLTLRLWRRRRTSS